MVDTNIPGAFVGLPHRHVCIVVPHRIRHIGTWIKLKDPQADRIDDAPRYDGTGLSNSLYKRLATRYGCFRHSSRDVALKGDRIKNVVPIEILFRGVWIN